VAQETRISIRRCESKHWKWSVGIVGTNRTSYRRDDEDVYREDSDRSFG